MVDSGNAIYISLAALAVSICSFLVSFTALHRDRHAISVRAVAFIMRGSPWLSITVSNHGKRPVSIAHVFVKPIGNTGVGRNIRLDGAGDTRIDVGQSFSLEIKPGDPICCWSTADELNFLDVEIEDALGKRYTAKFPRALYGQRLRRRLRMALNR